MLPKDAEILIQNPGVDAEPDQEIMACFDELRMLVQRSTGDVCEESPSKVCFLE